MFGKWLCKIGIHWMSGHKSYFVDIVSDKTVFSSTCLCGKKWMVGSLFPLPIFKVEHSDNK